MAVFVQSQQTAKPPMNLHEFACLCRRQFCNWSLNSRDWTFRGKQCTRVLTALMHDAMMLLEIHCIYDYMYIYIICHVCLEQACASCTLLSSCSFGKYGKGDPGNQFYPGLQENLHASYLKGNLRTKSNPQ